MAIKIEIDEISLVQFRSTFAFNKEEENLRNSITFRVQQSS